MTMKRIALILAMLCTTIAAVKAQDKDYVIVIHGGAGNKYGNFTMDFNSSGMFRGYIYREKGSENYKGEVGILQEMRTIK